LTKIILLALGLLAVYWILRSYRRRVDRGAGKPPAAGGEDMVQCAQCGVHLPRSESITTQGEFFCTAEHQRTHQAGRKS
jgi:uncharacterized protein